MNITPLKYLLFIEKSTCVFRNYSIMRNRYRILTGSWIFLELLVLSINIYKYLHEENEPEEKAQRIYFLSVTGFSIYVIISALYNTKTFIQLLKNFDAFYNFFDDVVYNSIMKKAQKSLAFVVLLFCLSKIVLFSYIRLDHGADSGEIGLIKQTFTHYNLSSCDFRYVYQYFILHSMLFVISEQLKAIIRSIDKDIKATWTDEGYSVQGESMKTVAVTMERLNMLDKWVNAYKNINDSCNLWNRMFRTQLTIMILIMTAYYIILLYSITILTFEGVPTVSTMCLNIFSMVVFLMALFVICRAGQNVQNNSLGLKQKLCQLNVLALDNEQYYKLTKDLLRCVSSRPCIVHIFGSYVVNMEILPSCVALFTTYTVIALQFNSVLSIVTVMSFYIIRLTCTEGGSKVHLLDLFFVCILSIYFCTGQFQNLGNHLVYSSPTSIPSLLVSVLLSTDSVYVSPFIYSIYFLVLCKNSCAQLTC